jgi:cytochrome c biogenesis protein CcmG, thiol:disulfide interchange protein DsbE
MKGAEPMRKCGLYVFFFIMAIGVSAGFSGCTGSAGAPAAPKVLANEPDVTFKDLQGKDLTLASLKGKVVVVNFWATWCDPCRVEIPWLIRMQQTYADKGFTLVGVAMDEDGKASVDPFVQSTHFDVKGQQMTMNYPIVLGNDELADKFGGMLGLPTSIVISRDGKIAKRYIGLVNEADLEKQIKELL